MKPGRQQITVFRQIRRQLIGTLPRRFQKIIIQGNPHFCYAAAGIFHRCADLCMRIQLCHKPAGIVHADRSAQHLRQIFLDKDRRVQLLRFLIKIQ